MIGFASVGSHAALTASHISTAKSIEVSVKVSGENSYCHLVFVAGLSFVRDLAYLVHKTARAIPSSWVCERTIC